jgi:hypothetical protein
MPYALLRFYLKVERAVVELLLLGGRMDQNQARSLSGGGFFFLFFFFLSFFFFFLFQLEGEIVSSKHLQSLSLPEFGTSFVFKSLKCLIS